MNQIAFSQSTRSGLQADFPTLDIAELRQIRDEAITTHKQGRQRWYENGLEKINWKSLNAEIIKFTKSALASIHDRLLEAATTRKSDIEFHILNTVEALGWHYASYTEIGELRNHPVFDISMNVSLHQTRLRAADLVMQEILKSGASCTLIKDPVDGPDCFVEKVLLKISI